MSDLVTVAHVQLDPPRPAVMVQHVLGYAPASALHPSGQVLVPTGVRGEEPVWVDRDEVSVRAVQPCPGRCNKAWRKAQASTSALTPQGIMPRPGLPVWCADCLDEIRRAVRGLPDLAASLWARGHHAPDNPAESGRDQSGVPITDIDEGRLSVVRAERSGSSAPGSPNLSASWAACDEIIAWAGRVEDRARALLRAGGRQGTWWAGPAEARARYLSSSVLWILARREVWAMPEAERWGREVLRMAEQGERLAGLDELVHHLGVCPTCDRKALIRVDGDDVVRCRSCKKQWSEDEWLWMVRVAVQAAKEKKA